jgi:hypothetical protein
MLQEWLAAMIGAEVGAYVQQSDSYHVYTDNPFWINFTRGAYQFGHVSNPYMRSEVQPFPLATSQEEAQAFQRDCETLCRYAETSGDILAPAYETPFFQKAVRPLVLAYEYYQKRYWDDALFAASACKATDWALACTEWIKRRQQRAAAKVQG